MSINFENPFRPGAGHKPPHLAGRTKEFNEFSNLLKQKIILDNIILTGLRGVGKTVLLDSFKPKAIEAGWQWVGTDISESATISEENIATRLLADLSVITSNLIADKVIENRIGFINSSNEKDVKLNFYVIKSIYDNTPGLVHDKLKNTLEIAWDIIERTYPPKGIIFAYDEAQNLTDHANNGQFPLSLLLDVFQSIQKKNIPFMLLLTGLPTLFPKLVESRTFSERMFRVLFLDKLNPEESRDAIVKPIESQLCPVKLTKSTINLIVELSGGYPYFIQFMCREIYDVFLQKNQDGQELSVPIEEIIIKLDTDFFSGRWSKVTDRQKVLIQAISRLENCNKEFTVAEIVESSKEMEKPFSSSHVNQMLLSLSNVGLVYKNRHGKYSFAVPLFCGFIKRQIIDS